MLFVLALLNASSESLSIEHHNSFHIELTVYMLGNFSCFFVIC